MHVVLFRHGAAIDRADPAAPADPDRPLTDEGIRDSRRTAEGLRRIGVSPELIVGSDYVRAVETAALAAEVFGVAAKENVVRTAALHPTADPRAFLEVLDAAPCREMLCVGHNPNLSGLLSLLVGAPRRPFTWLEKNGAARIDLGLDGRPPGRLVWLIGPAELLRLARDDGA